MRVVGVGTGRHARVTPLLVRQRYRRTLSRRARGSEHYRHGRPAGVSRRDLQPAPDTFRPLRHDRKTVAAVRALIGQCPVPSSETSICAYGGSTVAGHPQVLRAGVLAGVGDRLLGDAQQFGLDRRRAAGRSTRRARSAPAGRPAAPTVRAYSAIAAARPPCRSTSLRSSNRLSRSSVITRVTSARSVAQLLGGLLGVLGQGGQRVVDAVADHHQFLGDAVVDLPGQPLPLLVGGQRAHLVEEQRRLQPQRGRRRPARSPGRPRRGGYAPAASRLQDRPARPCARRRPAARPAPRPRRRRSRAGLRAARRSAAAGWPRRRRSPSRRRGWSPSRPARRRSGRAPPAGRRRWPDSTAARSTGRDRAHLLEQVLGDAARVERGAGQLPGHPAQLGQQAGRLRVRLRRRSRRGQQRPLQRDRG